VFELDDHDRVTVVGITGAGKTHFIRHTIMAERTRVVIWDPKHEYDNATLRVTPNELARLHQAKRVFDLDRYCIAVYSRNMHDETKMVDDFRDFTRLLEATIGNDTLIVVDEIALFEESKKAQSQVNYLATQSRHWHSPLVMVAQCAIQIPKIARRQSTIIVSFRQTDESDIDALRWNFNERADEIKSLPRRKCIIWRESDAFGDEGALDQTGESS